MSVFFTITAATLKMLVRNKQSLFFTWVLPLCLMLVIGFVTQSNDLQIRVGVVYDHANTSAQTVVDAMKQVEALEVTEGTAEEERAQLADNKRDLVVEFSPTFSYAPSDTVVIYENMAQQTQSAIGAMIVQQLFSAPPRVQITKQQISTRAVRYIDFLVPGIIAMTIMQLGIFGTAFAIVDAKQKGVLKRVMATPVRPWQYILGNMISRLILSMSQAAILVVVALFVFDVEFLHWDWLIGLILLGNAVFLSLGLFISGVAKTVESVPVLGNLIVFPMLLLGGVFFSTSNLPNWLRVIVEKLPIALLTDLMRNTVTYDKTLADVWPSLLLLGAWAMIALLLANTFFKLQENE